MSSDIKDSIEGIRQHLEEQNEREDLQKKAFDQLYEELRQYKEDFVFQNEKPLLLDLLLFYDSLNWFQQSLVKKEMSPYVIADSFQYLIDEFLEVLYRRDVLPVEGQERFDPQLHKAVKVVKTPREDHDYTVKEVFKRGFARAGKTLRAEEVVIYRHDDKADPPSDA